MKKLFTPLIALGLLLSLATSCKKDGDDTDRLANPSITGFQNLRNIALANLTQTKTFKAEDGLVFTSAKGTKLTISPGCLTDMDGNAVTGDVSLNFVEIFDRGNMVLANKPLMGRNGTGDLLPLITGGEFFVDVKKGNTPLRALCGYSMKVDANLTGGIDQAMILWTGNINEEGDLEWQAVGREGQKGNVNPNQETSTYDIFSGQFGWTNVDRFYSNSVPKTQIKVTVPEAYNNTNAAVYLSYKGEPGFLAKLDTYDTVDKFFSEHYGFIPVGMETHVIFISESNGSVAYAIKTVTIAANATINFGQAELNSTSMSNLTNMINNLD